jgi:hypothetical protein
MHSDPTLEILDSVTTTLGEAFCHFQRKICPKYHTQELNREVATRWRRQSKKADGSSAADLPHIIQWIVSIVNRPQDLTIPHC